MEYKNGEADSLLPAASLCMGISLLLCKVNVKQDHSKRLALCVGGSATHRQSGLRPSGSKKLMEAASIIWIKDVLVFESRLLWPESGFFCIN